jgi:hypothetical protein
MAKILAMAAPQNPPKPLAPEIQGRLQTAEHRLSVLEPQLGEVALDAATDKPGALEKAVEFDRLLHSAREEIERLRAAHQRAITTDAIAETKARRAQQQAHLAVIKNEGEVELNAASDLAAAVEKLERAYRRLMNARVNRLEVALNFVLPTGCFGPRGHELLENELYRQSKVHVAGDPDRLPGAESPYPWRPSLQTEPITEVVRRVNESIIATIERQIEADAQEALANMEDA